MQRGTSTKMSRWTTCSRPVGSTRQGMCWQTWAWCASSRTTKTSRPIRALGTQRYWPPEMQPGSTHHLPYDDFSVGLLLLACRTAQPPFMHLAHLPWEQQRLRRSYDELVACGCCDHLLPTEMCVLEQCLQLDVGRRKQIRELTESRYVGAVPRPSNV
ncbi:hypothetical protein COO60DRAFT_1544030 [Scenedesmus sp. NREL 46B-D3]|nr:hypothetical protein COO60DRAFT_1544030 [Scenedesmus sp. NREL 46B-D3]